MSTFRNFKFIKDHADFVLLEANVAMLKPKAVARNEGIITLYQAVISFSKSMFITVQSGEDMEQDVHFFMVRN